MQDDDELDIIELDENLADVEKPPILRAGKYEAEIQGVENAVGASKGTPYWAITWIIPADRCPPDIAQSYEDGYRLTYRRLMKPVKGAAGYGRAKYSLRKFYEALGLKLSATVDPNDWMGQRAILVVANGMYEGEPTADIKAIDPIESAPVASGTRSKRPRR